MQTPSSPILSTLDGVLTLLSLTVLRNPVYFIFLILCGVAAYVTFTLNLWGPIINMTNAASQQALAEGKKRLREFLDESPAARQALAAAGGEEYEMTRQSPRKYKDKVKTDGADDDVDDI